MSKLNQYVGLDVSLKETSIAVIDENDKLVWRGSAASMPEAIAEALKRLPHMRSASALRPVSWLLGSIMGSGRRAGP